MENNCCPLVILKLTVSSQHQYWSVECWEGASIKYKSEVRRMTASRGFSSYLRQLRPPAPARRYSNNQTDALTPLGSRGKVAWSLVSRPTFNINLTESGNQLISAAPYFAKECLEVAAMLTPSGTAEYSIQRSTALTSCTHQHQHAV